MHVCKCAVKAEILKSDTEAMMTCKAYNGRVITEWLAFELVQALHGGLGGNEEVRWCCIALTPGWEIVLRGPPRNALARFFGLMERAGRYLSFGSRLIVSPRFT